MRKALLLVFTLLMLASFSFGIVFAAAQNEFDENGWFQNQNMSALKTNEEGASEFTLGGSVPTYNRTEIDLTKINYLYFRTTSGDWTAFHLIDDTSIVSGNGATWYPSNNTEGKGHVKVSALLNDGAMQLGNGYATPEQGIIGTDKGSPSDVDRYMKFAFYIGTGEGDDVSYLEIDGVKIVGQAGTSLSVKRSDFANGKCYVALQTFSPNKTIAAMGINEDPARLPEVAFQPTGLGANNSAGFMLNETIADIPAEGYQITAEKAINNVTVNGKTLADVQAGLFVMTVPFGDSTIQSIGLLPSEGTSFSWKAGDEIVFKNGFVVYGPTGTPLYQISRDYGFSVISVDESGNCNFIPQVGLTWNGNSGNFVNLNLSYEVPCTAAVSDRNITAVTVNGEPLNSVGYFNLATPGIVQILKNEGEWNWKDGDTIKLPKDFTFKDSNGTVYCLDAAYKAVYAKGSFSFGKDFGINDYVPVSVDSMKLGHYDANGNMYGMQVYFSENVRGELEANSDVAGQEWFHSFVKINGKTLAEIKAMNIGTQDAPEYPSVRANFEGENFITLWIDGRAGVIEPGNNRVGDGNIVTILAGIRFPSGYETTEEVSFEFYNDGWKPVVVLEPIEFDVQNDAVLEGGSQGTDTKKAFINIPIKLSGFTDIPAIEIHGSQEVLEHIMFNGQLFSQMAAGTRVIQYNSANVLQIEIPQAAWNEGDKLVFLKGMPFFVDAPTKVGASAELARYYILECVIDSDGTPRFMLSDEVFKDIAIDGLFLDLTEYAERDQFDFSGMPTGLLNSARMTIGKKGEKTYTGEGQNLQAMPFGIDPFVLYINRQNFENWGINFISVAENELDAYNEEHGTHYMPHGYAEYAEGNAPATGLTLSENLAGEQVYKVFNNRISTNWEEFRYLAKCFTRSYRADSPTPNGFVTGWWFPFGWSVGGDCIGWDGEKYNFTLMDETPNYLATKEVTVNGKTYSAGDLITYEDKVNADGIAEIDGLFELPSQREAVTEFLRYSLNRDYAVDGSGTEGYQIMPSNFALRLGNFTNNTVSMVCEQYSEQYYDMTSSNK